MPADRSRPGSLSLVVGAVLLLWAIFAVDVVLRVVFGIHLALEVGLLPRERRGLAGIVCAHLLHADLGHIAANSLGLLILGTVSCWVSRRLTAWAVVLSALAAGAFTWLVAAPGIPHVGASGILFGLLGFIVANGLLRRSWKALLLAIPVGVLYAGAVYGMLPSEDNRTAMVSWQMHLGGFLGGVLASWWLRDERP